MESHQPNREWGHGALCLFHCASAQQRGCRYGYKVRCKDSFCVWNIFYFKIKFILEFSWLLLNAWALMTWLELFMPLCFSCRTEQLYQNVLALWHHSHINMKSVVSWHYLMADIRAIRNWNVASVCLKYYVFLLRLLRLVLMIVLGKTHSACVSYFHFYPSNHCR